MILNCILLWRQVGLFYKSGCLPVISSTTIYNTHLDTQPRYNTVQLDSKAEFIGSAWQWMTQVVPRLFCKNERSFTHHKFPLLQSCEFLPSVDLQAKQSAHQVLI